LATRLSLLKVTVVVPLLTMATVSVLLLPTPTVPNFNEAGVNTSVPEDADAFGAQTPK